MSDRLQAQINWLRWGLEEIARCADPRAGNNHALEFRIAEDALRAAGFPPDVAGIHKPSARLDQK